MSTSSRLVPLDVPWETPVRRKRFGLVPLLVLTGALTGAAGFGAAMLVLGGARSPNDLPVPAIRVAPIVFAEPWVATPLPIHVTPPGMAGKGFLQIEGLPALALLSEGYTTRPGSWTVPVSGLGTLKITSPGTEDSQPRLNIVLVSREGVVLSEARPVLAVIRPERIGSQPTVTPSLPPQCPALLTPAKVAEPVAAWLWPGVRQEARSLVRRGDEAMARGSIGAARQTYEYVAEEMRWPTAALALAATYDPHELAYLAPLVAADTEKARAWYEEARALANGRIEFHLRRLGPPAPGSTEPVQPMAVEPAPLWVWFGAMEAKTIVRWGDEAVARGYTEAARQIYEYAAVVMRWPTAALALAATYDKNELVHFPETVTPEPEKARLWYERSRELMNARIDFHLHRLGAPKMSRHARPERIAGCG